MLISFVIPCYRSARTISSVVYEIERTMNVNANREFEIILVNDNSPDDTIDVINKLAIGNSNIKIISLAKNFGQHAALMAGYKYSKGDVIVSLDDDGQTPANEVNKLIEAIESGYDVVYASYGEKKHSVFRNFGSKLNDFMAEALLEKPKEIKVSSYFAAKKYVINKMLEYDKAYPYLIGLVLRTTKNIGNVTVSHRKRVEGASGYTFKKLVGLWLNGFTAFSVKPLRMATIVGVLIAGTGFLYGLITIVKKIINPSITAGYSSLMAVILFVGGVIMLMLGLIGEYVGRIYICMNKSPQYVIKDTVNLE